jgi:hypothetical protein
MRPFVACFFGLASSLFALPALAGQYEFVPAPQTDLNRIYRIDRVTGEVGACQYGQKEGTFGVTLCFAAGDGAGKQEPSDYGLVASRHEREGGVFRTDLRTGAMSVCYVFDERVVCTPSEKGQVAGAPPSLQSDTTGSLNQAPTLSSKRP